MTDEIRPTYYVQYDEIDKTWCIFVHETHSDFFVAEFEEEKTAISICECMNDMMMRKHEMNDETQYVMVTTISSHRVRYAVPVKNADDQTVENVKNMVANEEVEEFSQLWLGEQIIDTQVVDEQRMLEMFDDENRYLSSWSAEQKIDHVKKSWIKS